MPTGVTCGSLRPMKCSIEECEKKSDRRGWCYMHYRRWKLYGDPNRVHLDSIDYEKKFWSRVNKTEDHWLWTRGHQHGYGKFMVRGKDIRAHRYSWTLEYGEIPEGAEVEHRCRETLCVRPDHLRLAQHYENGQNLSNVNPNSITGIRGVTRHKGTGKYHARVGFKGKMHFIGLFDSAEDAAVAVKLKRLELHTYNEEDRQWAIESQRKLGK